MKYILLILIILVAGVMIMVRWQADKFEAFLAQSERVEGSVISKQDVIKDPKNRRKEWTVTYRYSTRDGKEYTNEEAIEFQDLWQTYQASQKADVYYSKNSPHQSYLAEPMDRRLGRLVKPQENK